MLIKVQLRANAYDTQYSLLVAELGVVQMIPVFSRPQN